MFDVQKKQKGVVFDPNAKDLRVEIKSNIVTIRSPTVMPVRKTSDK